MSPRSPNEAGAGTAAPRWWIAPCDLPAERRKPCQLTTEEKILESRVARHAAVGNFRIPQMPVIAARVANLLANPDAESVEIAQLIHQDQQLAADVMSFSNSALFAGAAKNTNIPEAIGRVGFRRTRSIIFAASLRSVIYRGCEPNRAEMLWQHACGCAAISARIAQNLRCNVDDLYLAGLFHDVGKTVLLSLVDTIAVRSQNESPRPEFVEYVLLRHHESAGEAVARHWRLPEHIAEAVRNHTESPGIRLTPLQAIVALANNACWRLNVGEKDDGRPIAGPEILDRLGAREDDLPRILDGVLEAVRSI